MDAKPDLFRLRHFSVRRLSQEDLLAAQPVYHIGQGKIGILCLHGFTVTPASFYKYGRVFMQKGYSVSIPMLPGHGETPEALSKIKWTEWLDCTIENYDILRKKCDHVFVMGSSLGGVLALQLATLRNDVTKLFLLAPAIEPSPLFKIGKCLFGFFDLIKVRYWFHIAGDTKNPNLYEIGYKRTPLSALSELYDCIQQAQLILPQVHTDTLIFQARTDHETDPKGAEVTYQKISSRNKEIVWLDNSYHAITQDYCGKEVLDRILREISLA